MNKSFFGVIGLGVMGKSLSLNMADRQYAISVYNRAVGEEAGVVRDFMAAHASYAHLQGFTDLADFVASLETPRKILIMIKAGEVVDVVIQQLIPLLEAGDVIIDGGNTHFRDTQRRAEVLREHHIYYLGCGISGGEAGARNGPSLMPGGSASGYATVAPVLRSIAAKDRNGEPCCAYIGPDGAGHFVKMVHNGIEYAEMQLLAEVYALLSPILSAEEIAQVLERWNKGDLSGYLLEITIRILRKREGDGYLLDKILDKAGYKGTGSWTGKVAFDLGAPAGVIVSAVFARYIAAHKSERKKLSNTFVPPKLAAGKINTEALEKAYRFARIVNHHQGFELMQHASEQYQWELSLPEIARIWTNGCIIRSALMEKSVSWLREKPQFLEHEAVLGLLRDNEAAVTEVLRYGLDTRIALPAFSAACQYWTGMTTERLPAHLIQAQRDYFGAHTYQRTDAPAGKFFHTNWEEL